MNKETDQLMDKYFAGELNDQEVAEFQTQMKSNSDFREEVEFLESLQASLMKEDKLELKLKLDDIHQSLSSKSGGTTIFLHKRNIFLYAAMLIVLLTVGYLAINYSQRDTGLQTEYLADNYEKSPVYETLLESELRAIAISMTSPESGSIFTTHEKISFEWQTNYTKGLRLCILQNINQTDVTIYQFDIEPNIDGLTMKKTLKTGRYYWKMESESEILYIGYFLVE